ncbi:DHA2 family efflux MFS transporter permease subunit [Actinoallomurus sp. CA-142502]|uniref:DHA2 family efflux MFS transporter permease subunit n=1 Tax=Actinoallomurus sp. CA-142502 TaxID=3239885 RepID=UPI003D8BDB86
MTKANRVRWVALAVVCAGSLMNVLDTTIVGVALPAIQHDLGFSQASLAWVVNAYLLTYGGFLVLGGRLGDLFGHRRLFAAAVGVFTLASLACGLAPAQGFLLAARAVQGLAGAIASAVALSLVVSLFPEPAGRAKAMGLFGLINAGGASIGVLAGGVLTGLLSWQWIFWVNVPIGAAVLLASLRVLPTGPVRRRGRLDVVGAALVTAGMLLAVYAINGVGQTGWTSSRTIGLLAAVAVLLAAFVAVESRTAAPLVPLRLLRQRNLTAAGVIGLLWTAAMFANFFLTTLYLQQVLGYSALQTGLAFLPSNLLMAGVSAGASARLVARFGTRPPLVAGLLLVAAGLALLGHAPVAGHFAVDVLPGGILLGAGAGTAMSPLLLAAIGDLPPDESGLASGIVNTSIMLGGALGLAVLANVATGRTDRLTAAGHPHLDALTSGYHAAYLTAAACAALAALLAARWLRPGATPGNPAPTPTARPALATTSRRSSP